MNRLIVWSTWLALPFVLTIPTGAAVVCASLPTMAACVECGAAKYGRENQVRHCRANWKPGMKKETISKEEAIKRFGK